MTLVELETIVKRYSEARGRLAEKVQKYETEIGVVKKQNFSGIKTAAVAAAEKEAELRAAIDDAPDLFIKPRTLIMHGIKFGYQKQKGTVEFEDDEKVIQLIRKVFPDRADLLIKTEDKLIKSSLENLTAAELKRLGCEVKESGDVVLIKSVESEIDKVVNTLLKEIGKDTANA